MVKVRLIEADVMEGLKGMADESVQCVVTSPPYWGLRDYGIEPQVWGGEAGCEHGWGEKIVKIDYVGGNRNVPDEWQKPSRAAKAGNSSSCYCRLCGAWKGSLGLEPTIEMFVGHITEIFREVRRVLRKDGVLFLNLGDSYASGGNGGGGKHVVPLGEINKWHQAPGLKPKDLCGIPWRVALALQADGWYLRSEITWCKKSPMPESVTDRPTNATEKIFMLTKSPRYFYDAEAVREKAVNTKMPGHNMTDTRETHGAQSGGNSGLRDMKAKYHNGDAPTSRNLWNYWILGPEPFKQAHFAVFPSELVRRCVAAGTSERGCCPSCGAPWKRVVEKVKTFESGSGKSGNPISGKNGPDLQGGGDTGDIRKGPCLSTTTTGWVPTCTCNKWDKVYDCNVPCTVLDPFSGAGTTALVAAKMGRDAIGVELNPEYVEMSRKRITGELGMLVEVEVIRGSGTA